MYNLILIVAAYLLGSIPSGVIIGKVFYNKDIRDYGSHNIGTTNAFRVLGKVGGLAVFFADVGKGVLPVLVARAYPDLFTWSPLVFGLAAVLGHTFPVYLKFKGGKAVATSLGMALAYNPFFALMAILVFALVLWFSSMVSLSSITAMLACSVTVTFWIDASWFFRCVVYLLTVFIIIRHWSNIKRIFSGTESKVPFGLGSRHKE